MKNIRYKIIRVIILINLVFNVFILALIIPWKYGFIYNVYISKDILNNVWINQIQVGGRDYNQIKSDLKKSLLSKNKNVLLIYNDEEYTITEDNIGLKYDLDKTIKSAYRIGRGDDVFQNLKKYFSLQKRPQILPLNFMYDNTLLKQRIASISAKINTIEVLPQVQIINDSSRKIASVSAGIPGIYVDEIATKEIILNSFSRSNYNSNAIPVVKTSVSPSSDQISSTERIANNILNKSINLISEDESWQLSGEELINFLSVYDKFDDQKIASWTAQLADTVNRDPINALFEFEGNRVREFQAGKDGLQLDQAQTVKDIKQAMMTLSTNQEDSYNINLKFKHTAPEITTDNVNDFGIKERIGFGESWFGHSIPGRIHNVALSASKINGVLVPPGEIFSFVKSVGEIDAAHGYQSSYIIQNGRTVLGDGGGVCQTSTTLFRAALDAGLEIVERNAHAYRVGYYEENYDVGVDATIFSPSVDLKFRNDTEHYILIQTHVDTINTYALFEIYGTKDGRVATISKSTIWDQTPPPPDRYQDDPSLPKGVVKQVDWKAWGAKVSFDWKVIKDGQVLHEQTFYSNYRPWQAVFLRGV